MSKYVLPLDTELFLIDLTQNWVLNASIADSVQVFAKKTWEGPDPVALQYLALAWWIGEHARQQALYAADDKDRDFNRATL